MIGLKLFFLFIVLTHCASYPMGPTNRDHEQDKMCYAKYGGQLGYCDKSIHEKN